MNVIRLWMFCMQCPSDAVQTVCEVAAGLKDGTSASEQFSTFRGSETQITNDKIRMPRLQFILCFYFWFHGFFIIEKMVINFSFLKLIYNVKAKPIFIKLFCNI